MTCRKSLYVAFFWFAFITERRRRRRSSSNGNFLPWWKNWLRGTCFPLHSLITRHSKTYGCDYLWANGTSAFFLSFRRPLNNDVSLSILSGAQQWLGWSGYGRQTETTMIMGEGKHSCICIFNNFNDASASISRFTWAVQHNIRRWECKFRLVI